MEDGDRFSTALQAYQAVNNIHGCQFWQYKNGNVDVEVDA